MAGGVLATVTSFWLRTRMPASLVAGLLMMAGAAIGWGGMVLQPRPSPFQTVLAVAALAVLVPFHIRVVLGPFGAQRANGDVGHTGR